MTGNHIWLAPRSERRHHECAVRRDSIRRARSAHDWNAATAEEGLRAEELIAPTSAGADGIRVVCSNGTLRPKLLSEIAASSRST